MKIYLVRHGETDYNARSLYYGFADVSLNEKGMIQAMEIGRQLKHIAFDKVYVSDLSRTSQTAQMILKMNEAAAKRNPELIRVPELKEINFGVWEGHTYEEIVSMWPDEYEIWAMDWMNAAPPEGEAFTHFYERCKEAFLSFVNSEDDATILIAAHNGSLRVILAVMLGLSAEGTWHFNFEQDAYSLVDYEYDNFTVRKINSREMIDR